MHKSFVVRFLQIKLMERNKYRHDNSIYFRTRGNFMQLHQSQEGHGAQVPCFGLG